MEKATSKSWGGYRPNSGRKPRAEEQRLVEKLTPLDPLGFEALEKAIRGGEQWAVKLWMNYRFGMPAQNIDVSTLGQSINDTRVTFINGSQSP